MNLRDALFLGAMSASLLLSCSEADPKPLGNQTNTDGNVPGETGGSATTGGSSAGGSGHSGGSGMGGTGNAAGFSGVGGVGNTGATGGGLNTGGSGGVAEPPKPGRPGFATVAGGVLMKSPSFRLVVTTGEAPGHNSVSTSVNFRLHGGVIGTSQP